MNLKISRVPLSTPLAKANGPSENPQLIEHGQVLSAGHTFSQLVWSSGFALKTNSSVTTLGQTT